jgi:predicted secreted protein
MDIKSTWFAVVVVCLVLLAGCSTGPHTVSRVDGSKGQPGNLKTGDILQIILKSDPINGYGWIVERIDPAYLESSGKDQYTPLGQDPVAGGTQVLSFKALKPGTTQLGLAYKRSSGEGVSLPKEFKITVDIK